MKSPQETAREILRFILDRIERDGDFGDLDNDERECTEFIAQALSEASMKQDNIDTSAERIHATEVSDDEIEAMAEAELGKDCLPDYLAWAKGFRAAQDMNAIRLWPSGLELRAWLNERIKEKGVMPSAFYCYDWLKARMTTGGRDE